MARCLRNETAKRLNETKGHANGYKSGRTPEKVALALRPPTVGVVAAKVVEEGRVALEALAARLPEAGQTHSGKLGSTRPTERDRFKDFADDRVHRIDYEAVDRLLDRLQRHLQDLAGEEAEDVACGGEVGTRASALELWVRRGRRGVLTSATPLLWTWKEFNPRGLEREHDVAHAAAEAACSQ